MSGGMRLPIPALPRRRVRADLEARVNAGLAGANELGGVELAGYAVRPSGLAYALQAEYLVRERPVLDVVLSARAVATESIILEDGRVQQVRQSRVCRLVPVSDSPPSYQ